MDFLLLSCFSSSYNLDFNPVWCIVYRYFLSFDKVISPLHWLFPSLYKNFYLAYYLYIFSFGANALEELPREASLIPVSCRIMDFFKELHISARTFFFIPFAVDTFRTCWDKGLASLCRDPFPQSSLLKMLSFLPTLIPETLLRISQLYIQMCLYFLILFSTEMVLDLVPMPMSCVLIILVLYCIWKLGSIMSSVLFI